VNTELRALVADVLGIDAGDIGPGSGPGTTENWDSLAHLSIITAIEERFGIKFGMAEIRGFDNLETMSQALAARLDG